MKCDTCLVNEATRIVHDSQRGVEWELCDDCEEPEVDEAFKYYLKAITHEHL